VCFHCQQSAEKYLKALLKEARVRIPRTHELVALLSLLPPHYSLRGFRRGLEFLTRFAIETRYPGKSASKRQAASALRWATKVRRRLPRAARSLTVGAIEIPGRRTEAICMLSPCR
jgi:HEPN domain-containing protein